ncbi:hypothetical protein JEZ13_05365 [bacterium]|nr:hypothetical protein [bacterium]
METNFNVYEVYKLMENNQIQFSYKGPITQEVLISLGDTIKEKLHRDDCDVRVVRKVFSVLVEAAHNILRYSSEQTDLSHNNRTTGIGLIGIGKTEANLFVIFSGNIISQKDKDIIEKKISFINSLSRKDLQESYKTQLRKHPISEDGSAGLGLFEVARKSDRPIEYNFSQLDTNKIFFELKIFVQVED